MSRVLLVIALSCAVAIPALCEQPTFADMLARAQAQAAAGHRWSPVGDNMTETVAEMMDIIATATPQQLADLSDLLEKNASNSPVQPPAQTTSARAFPAQATQAETALAPVIPIPILPSQSAPAQVVPPQPAPVLAAPSPITPVQAALPQITPAPAVPTRVAPDPMPAPGSQTNLTPDLRTSVTQTTVAERSVPSPARTAQRPSPRAMELYARGQDAERQGNVSGARRFYVSAAEQGSAAAARGLGRLYDPDYLRRTALGGIDADPAIARRWYERAIAMGDAEAGSLLDALAVR